MAKNIKQLIESLKKETIKYKQLGGMHVEVGLPSNRIHEPSGKPLAEVGAIHEFGLQGIQERSFLRGFLRSEKSRIRENFKITAESVAAGVEAKDALEKFANWGEGEVQEYISNGRANFAPIAPREDGSDNPLNDTGALKRGIIGVVVND